MLNEILMTADLAAYTLLWTIMTVITLTVIIFFFHRKARRLDYLAVLAAISPLFMLSAYCLAAELIEHINFCYPPTGNYAEIGNVLLFADMVTIPVIATFTAAVLKAGRIMAIVWAKTADEGKAFHAFGLSLSESFGAVHTVLKKEAKKVRSLDFLSMEVKEDEY